MPEVKATKGNNVLYGSISNAELNAIQKKDLFWDWIVLYIHGISDPFQLSPEEWEFEEYIPPYNAEERVITTVAEKAANRPSYIKVAQDSWVISEPRALYGSCNDETINRWMDS